MATKALSVESRLRLLTLKTGECHIWIGPPTMKLRVRGRMRDVRELAAELAGKPRHPGKVFIGRACSTSKCIHPEHVPVRR